MWQSGFKTITYRLSVSGDQKDLARFQSAFRSWVNSALKADRVAQESATMWKPEAVRHVTVPQRLAERSNGTYTVNGNTRRLDNARVMRITFDTRYDIASPIEDFAKTFPALVFDGTREIIDGSGFLAVNGQYESRPYVEEVPFEDEGD